MVNCETSNFSLLPLLGFGNLVKSRHHQMNILRRLCASTPNRTACFAQIPKAFSGTPVGMDASEATTFKSLSDQWWDRDGEFRALHALNSIRLEMVNNLFKDESPKPWYPLYGMKIVDVGCGGGILSEPLARLGAKVLGIDLLPECIAAAKDHVTNISPKQWVEAPFGAPEYQSVGTQDVAAQFPGKFDAVIASELLEHVSDWEKVVRDASACLKPGGHFIATTINRTMLSYWLAIVVAENVLKITPRGTHTWDKFIEPSELCMAAVRHNLQPRKVIGITYNPLSNSWSWTSSQSINYAFHAVKLSPGGP